MAKVYVTRKIPESGIELLKNAGHEVIVSEKNGVLTHTELIDELHKHNPDAVLPLLTDKIDADVFDAAPNAKIFASYSVGYGHFDLDAANERGVTCTNTPGVLTDTVAEHTVGLICAISQRIVEADKFTRAGKYKGWSPMLMLGTDLKGKTLGVLGAGRIGSRVAEIMHKGFGMKIMYYDIKENDFINNELSGEFRSTPEDLLRDSDVVTVHVPLLDSTRGMLNKERLSVMKPSAVLVNTSRGKVIDEKALLEALKDGTIKSAALDVYENEPELTPGLAELDNVILTPHIASASLETREKMSTMAAQNIIDFLDGKEPQNKVS